MYEQSFTNNSFNQTNTPSKKEPVRRLQSVTPVVVRQIRDHPGEEFSLFGMPTQILMIVGILRDYEIQSTKATYKIEDHTGAIKAIWWLENDSNTTPALPPVKEGCYVQLFGTLRKQDDEKFIMVLRMFPVDKHDVITSHLLQVIYTRLEAEALSKNGGAKIAANNPGTMLANSMSFMDESSNNMGAKLSGIQEKVSNVLEQNDTPTGMHIQALLRHFPPHEARQVKDALEFLITEGHAYSTIDNDHYKLTTTM